MSKNISIAEGGVARQFTNDKLKINLVGGGTEYYVPESSVQLTTKSVTQNGTYKASDVGKYGFSQVTVNVRGGSGSADSSGKPNTSGTGPLPGGAGSAVVGTDPETGNDEFIGVDSSGNLVTTPLPSSIVLVTNPTKMSYNDGEAIDLSGAVVVAKNADGTTWTDADHPNGHVSCSCDPTTADISVVPAYSKYSSTLNTSPTTQPIEAGDIHVRYEERFSGYDIVSDINVSMPANSAGLVYVNIGGHGYWHLFASKERNQQAESVYVRKYKDTGEIIQTNTDVWTASNSYTFAGKTVFYEGGSHGYLAINTEASPAQPLANKPDDFANVAWTIIYGDKIEGGTQTITLNWARPGDGKVLSTTMDIQVSSSTENNEGGGGGHSF